MHTQGFGRLAAAAVLTLGAIALLVAGDTDLTSLSPPAGKGGEPGHGTRHGGADEAPGALSPANPYGKMPSSR